MDIQPFGGRDDGDGDGDHHYHHHRASTRGGPKMAQRGEVAASMPCHDCAGEETAKRRSLGSEQIRFLAHNITAVRPTAKDSQHDHNQRHSQHQRHSQQHSQQEQWKHNVVRNSMAKGGHNNGIVAQTNTGVVSTGEGALFHHQHNHARSLPQQEQQRQQHQQQEQEHQHQQPSYQPQMQQQMQLPQQHQQQQPHQQHATDDAKNVPHATARLLTSDSVAHPSTLSLQGSDQSAPHLHHHPRHPLHLSTLQPGGIGPSMASSSILQQQQQRPMSMSASLPLSQPTIAAPSALPYSSGGPSFRSNSNSNGSSNAGINANGNADATRTTVLGNANGSNVGESQNHNRPLNVLARPMPNGDHQIAWSRMLNQSDTPTILTLTAFPFRIFDLNEAAVSLLGKGCVSHSLFDYFVRENTWRPTLVSHPTLLGRAHDGEIVKVRCSGNNVYCFCKIRINGVRCPSDVAAAKGNAPDQELAGYVVYLERLDLPLHMASSVIYRSFP